MDSIIVAVVVLFLALAALRLARRPKSLRRYPPGPAGIPFLGALHHVGSMPHVGLADLAKRYGPVMFLKMGTSNVVVASSPKAARTFLKTLDLQYANRPFSVTMKEVTYNKQNFVFSNYGARWKLVRRLLNVHMLGAKAMADWARARGEEIGHMLRTVHEACRDGEPVLVTEALVRANANVLGRVMLSRRVFEASGEESSQFKDAILDLLTGVGLFNLGEFVTSIAWMDLQGVQGKLHKVHRRMDDLITKMIAEHEATAGEREGAPDFLDLVMANRADADGEELSDVHVKALILDMFIAGVDTSSVITEWALAEMLKNPAIIRRAQAEMDEVIGKGRRLEESDIPMLPYLRALCKEALRLHPSTPLSVPHFSFEECEVDGYYIPPNTRLFVNIWAIGRDPDVWENPLTFDPERFLSGPGARIEPFGNDFEFIPFGSGRRICVGMQFGMLMLQYFLGTLVHSFDWKLADGEELNMDEKFGVVLPKAVPLKAVLKPRLAPAAYA